MNRRAIVLLLECLGMEKEESFPNLEMLGLAHACEKMHDGKVSSGAKPEKIYASYGYGQDDRELPAYLHEILAEMKERKGQTVFIGRHSPFAWELLTKREEVSSPEKVFTKLQEEIRTHYDLPGIIIADFKDVPLSEFEKGIMGLLDGIYDEDVVFILSSVYLDKSPFLMCSKTLPLKYFGKRQIFADISRTIAVMMHLASGGDGISLI